jgi:hypothetical protein
MSTEKPNSNEFELFRQQLQGKPTDELSRLIIERFDDEFPPDGLFAGNSPDRIRQFIQDHLRLVCEQLGKDTWEALGDERTAHNVERFALTCAFFASHVFKGSHWPAHEITAFVLLVISTLSKGGRQA